uniref:Uncharacterized protein n=1 Tax=Hucho hucho TaxID=62062 RepID=A0A4W5QZJ3_9TELE
MCISYFLSLSGKHFTLGTPDAPKPSPQLPKDVVEHLLETGANVHARDDGGLIPLHNACSFGHAEVVSLLLCQGADPNSRDSWNYTPLHEAAIKGKLDVCIGQNSFSGQKLKPLCNLLRPM